MNIAGANHESEAVGEEEKCSVEMERPPGQSCRNFDGQQNLDAIGFRVHDEGTAGGGEDEEGGRSAVVLGKTHPHQNHSRKMQQSPAAANPEQSEIQDQEDSRRQQSD